MSLPQVRQRELCLSWTVLGWIKSQGVLVLVPSTIAVTHTHSLVVVRSWRRTT